MIARDAIEHAPAEIDQIEQGENQHVGERGAHEIADAEVRGTKSRGIEVGGELRKGGGGGQQQRADPQPAERARLGNRVCVAREARAAEIHHGRHRDERQ